ncbi:DNA-directed RNA polymerase III subunit RPC9-like [Mercenaria mercenaria]|uniref:DNA-directed RNA polymerase III subunit RPC9-like n=1 Tax=Mercenaria mercenaria TaxID=6596 RepID=UPI001E1DA2BD|nr:DNA-directed RNA polymerase III subunit RPC9-like [Mercenaria mercenaria]
MEVKNDKSAMLSNYEVLNLLSDMHKGQSKQSKLQTNLATISYEITHYLENSACSKQSPELLANFIKALDRFKLTKAEKMQLLNLRPKTAVEIQLIVEESEERLTEDQIYELLDLVKEHLPGGDEEEEMEEDDQGQE